MPELFAFVLHRCPSLKWTPTDLLRTLSKDELGALVFAMTDDEEAELLARLRDESNWPTEAEVHRMEQLDRGIDPEW